MLYTCCICACPSMSVCVVIAYWAFDSPLSSFSGSGDDSAFIDRYDYMGYGSDVGA